MDDCIFCKIVKGELPSHKIYEDEKHIAILSIYPNTDGFSIVLAKEHKPSYIFENDDKTLSDLILAAKKTAQKIDSAFEDVGRTGLIGEGFGVDHLHVKLFPMHGTGDMKEWAKIESTTNNTFYEKYPGFLSSNDSERADDKKLAEIAEKIRKAK